MAPILATRNLTLLHSERPKLYTILAFLSAIGIRFATQILYVSKNVPLAKKLISNLD